MNGIFLFDIGEVLPFGKKNQRLLAKLKILKPDFNDFLRFPSNFVENRIEFPTKFKINYKKLTRISALSFDSSREYSSNLSESGVEVAARLASQAFSRRFNSKSLACTIERT